MIVKNEEANLPACLPCVADLVDEMILVDTGSTDRTKEVALGLGARVFDFPWIDDFAAARNECLRHASGGWIFILDSDERLDEENRRRLGELFANLTEKNAAYMMKQVSPSKTHTGSIAYDHVRLFPNHPKVRWRYRVHEQILPAIEEQGIKVKRTDIRIVHTGFQEAALDAFKDQRNLRLLHLQNDEQPDDPFTLFNLAGAYQELGRLPEALSYGRRSLERASPGHAFVHSLYSLLARVLRQLGQPGEAAAICREGLMRFPNDAGILFQYAWVLYLFGDFYGTESCLLQLLQPRSVEEYGFEAGEDPGYRGHLTRHNLAILYRDQQRFPEAEAQWQAALAERPDCTEALLGLGELYLQLGRWPEMERVLQKLQEDPQTVVKANILRGQQLLARQEFATARQLMEATIATAPQELGPRLVLSRILWQEGRDWAAVEQALRAVLAIDPNHAEARANLARLRPA
jgi:glycosyltransferase involved in cell wall biosynthesis